MRRAMRWGDNDRYAWPFTWNSSSDYKHWAVVLTSWGNGEDDDGPCNLRITLWRYTLITILPPIVRPHRRKVYPGWDVETVKRLGRDWYWDVDTRRYGFSLTGAGDVGRSSFLQVFYGREGGSMMDSSIQQSWTCFLPWTQWRHVRHSYYGLEGEHFHTIFDEDYRLGAKDWRSKMDAQRAIESRVPSREFCFDDFDGERLVAKTGIEEREWRAGEGWFKWLSWFHRPKIIRSLDIEFSGETGHRKGSWKGGTIGHSIEMLPGELHAGAFERYCAEHDMKFRGPNLTVNGP